MGFCVQLYILYSNKQMDFCLLCYLFVYHHTTQIIGRLNEWLYKERMDFFLSGYNLHIIVRFLDIYLFGHIEYWIL